MKGSNDLHTLIKSLTKSEKRLFKIHVNSAKKNQNNYTILFDAIDAQEEYNEVLLSRKLRKHTFSKQISRTKYLLYEQILKVLRQLFSSKMEHRKLGSLLDTVEVLFYKTLYHQANEILKRAKKIALSHELYGWQHKIMDWEKQLIPYLENHKTIRLSIDGLSKSYECITHQVNRENEYKMLHTRVRLYYDSILNFHKKPDVAFLFKEVMAHPLLKNEENATTFLSKILFHEIHFTYANACLNPAEAYQHGATLFKIWEANPIMKNVFREIFIRQLRDYTYCVLSYHEVQKDIALLLKEWKAIPVFSKEEESKLALEMDTIHFLLQLVNRQYTGIETIHYRIKEQHFSSIEKLPIHQKMIIFYHLAVYHFFGNRYEEVLKWIKKTDELAGGKIHPHILKYIRLMELMVYYELEDKDVEDKDILRVTRHLKSLGSLSVIEKTLLTTVKKLMNTPQNEETFIFQNLKKTLENYSHPQTINKQVIGFWVKKRLKTTPIF